MEVGAHVIADSVSETFGHVVEIGIAQCPDIGALFVQIKDKISEIGRKFRGEGREIPNCLFYGFSESTQGRNKVIMGVKMILCKRDGLEMARRR